MRCNIVLLSLLTIANAYIPAVPTNSTQDAIAGGLNLTDISKLSIQWYPNGSYAEHVAYQISGNGSTGISKGALVHFSEEIADKFIATTTLAPWIALVSCDKNATNSSMSDDIFTLARDRVAVSTLLYSLTSTSCIVNPGYANDFEFALDIFSTQSAASSHLIESQFGQLTSQNKSLFNYDSGALNNSATDVLRSIEVGYPVSTGYLLATLQAYNATTPTSNTNSNFNSTKPGGSTANTARYSVQNYITPSLLGIILSCVITVCT